MVLELPGLGVAGVGVAGSFVAVGCADASRTAVSGFWESGFEELGFEASAVSWSCPSDCFEPPEPQLTANDNNKHAENP